MLRIIRGISSLLIGILLLLLALLWIPKLFDYEIYYVSSGSMEPAVHVADAIFVKRCGLEELNENDIVTYALNQGATLVTHRVVTLDREKKILQTKGDANSEADPVWIRSDLVIGKLQFQLPYLGHLVLLLSTGSGKLLVLGIFLWLTALQMMVEQWIIPKKRKEKNT